jgi:DNA-directed RNA polymerase subunit RPC12/RpoP
MEIGKYFKDSTILRVMLILWIVSSAITLVLWSQIDSMVNGELYNYGLKFNYDWWASYSAIFRIAQAFILFHIALSIVVLSLNLFAWLRGEKLDLTVKTKPPLTASEKVVSRKVERNKEPKKEAEQGTMLIACSKCGKTFARPLLMLDFSGERTRLINVCPYCSAKLGENDRSELGGFYIKEPEEKKTYKNE